MMRKRRLPASLNLELHEGGMLQTQKLTPPPTEDEYKFNQQDQINQNKKFLTHILKYSNPSVKLPQSITSRSIEESLRALNVRLASIASSKEILADYEKHFRALNIFFERLINQGKRLPLDEQPIWKMFFLNNMAIVAFNNGDYTTSLYLLKQIMDQLHKKQLKHPVFTLAITNLSAIYYKMDSKTKCFQHLQMAFDYSKKLVDSSVQTYGSDPQNQRELNYVWAIQCIMMVKNKLSLQDTNHNIKQIQKLIVKLVRQANKSQSEVMIVPYINKYLEQKKLTELKQIQSSVAGSLTGSLRSRKKNYHLQSISYQYNAELGALSRQISSQHTQLDSPVKRYSYNKIRQQIDQLNSKVTRLQLKTNNIQTSIIEVLNILKFNNKIQEKSVNKTDSLSGIQNILGISNVVSRCTFKTLQIFIKFYDQGIKLRTFTSEQEKLSWGELQNIFKLLDLLHIYFQYLEFNPTRHSIAWVISKYITIDNGIKIKKQPSPILTFEHNGHKYNLYHIRERQFTIYGHQIQAVIFQMCQKSFNYYFEVLKVDQFEAQCMDYFSDEPSKIRQDYFLEVIQAKAGGTFQQDILQVFGHFKTMLKETSNKAASYRKVKLWFDQTTDACDFIGAYYHLTHNNQLQNIQIKLYPLNLYEGVNITDPILKVYTFSELQTRFSFTISQISSLNLQYLYINLVDMVSLRIQAIKRVGKTRYVIHSISVNPQCVYFQQRMILKKYYRPLFIFVLRTKTRYIGIRFSHYNEAQLLTTNITIILNTNIKKKISDNPDEMNKKFVKIKNKIKTEFLVKQFGQIESGIQTKYFIHVEEFIGMIQAQTKNWGQ